MSSFQASLNWIRTFERVARLRSFQSAAEKLNVTPSAVSQQIRKLEQALEQPLFLRNQYPVTLTAAGQALFDQIERPLHLIEEALRRRDSTQGGRSINVWGSRVFMRLWLLPRLHSFDEAYPNLAVELSAASPTSAVPPDCDIAIRIGPEQNPDLHHEELMRRIAVPVCSPGYLMKNGPVASVDEYRNHLLLKGSIHENDWNLWLAANNVPQISMSRIRTLSSSDLTYAAALEGVGIALCPLTLIEKDLAAGRLVQLIGEPADVGTPFYLFYHQDRASDPAIRSFVAWIRKEVALSHGFEASA